MTNETIQTTAKLPTHEALHVRNREGKKGHWTRIGNIWPNKDGSQTLLLDFIPLDGRIIIREITAKPTA